LNITDFARSLPVSISLIHRNRNDEGQCTLAPAPPLFRSGQFAIGPLAAKRSIQIDWIIGAKSIRKEPDYRTSSVVRLLRSQVERYAKQ
jgi:hypothetical protein